MAAIEVESSAPDATYTAGGTPKAVLRAARAFRGWTQAGAPTSLEPPMRASLHTPVFSEDHRAPASDGRRAESIEIGLSGDS
jgi:hypothetical protein